MLPAHTRNKCCDANAGQRFSARLMKDSYFRRCKLPMLKTVGKKTCPPGLSQVLKSALK